MSKIQNSPSEEVCNDEFMYEKDTNMTDMNWSEDMQHQKPKMMDDSIMQSRKPDLTDVTRAVYDHCFCIRL